MTRTLKVCSVRIHPHVLKHGLSEAQILQAWESTVGRKRPRDNTRWIALGFDLAGHDIEMVAVQLADASMLIIHADTPVKSAIKTELGLERN